MKGKGFFSGFLVLAGLGLALVCVFGFRAGDESDLTADELIQRHVASIAPQDHLEARQSFVMKGDLEYTVLVGPKIAPGPGMTQIISQGRKYNIIFKFESGEYGGEQYVTNGKEARTAYSTPGDRNPMTEFLQAQQALLNEGLLGGELTTAWALLDVDGRNPRLKLRGLKNVEGVELYELDYRIRKGGSDLTNKLYFEPQTYHHVLSTYEVQIAAPMGANPTDSARQRPSRFKLEERFGGFQDFDGFTLPSTWTVQFSQSKTDSTILYQWKTTFTQSALDMDIPAKVFEF